MIFPSKFKAITTFFVVFDYVFRTSAHIYIHLTTHTWTSHKSFHTQSMTKFQTFTATSTHKTHKHYQTGLSFNKRFTILYSLFLVTFVRRQLLTTTHKSLCLFHIYKCANFVVCESKLIRLIVRRQTFRFLNSFFGP